MYDIIGDIHGFYPELKALLKKMGYKKVNGVFSHPERKVIFTGDYINRGPQIRKTVQTVRDMVDNGHAYAILGNHELNAILYETIDSKGKLFRKQLPRLRMASLKTLKEYEDYLDEWRDVVKWFRKLPVYLDFDDLRVVHACWDDQHIETYNEYKAGEIKMKKSFLKEYIVNDELNDALTALVKGLEFVMPRDLAIKDQKGISHRRFRMKWWESPKGKTFKDIAFGNRFELPNYTIPKEVVADIETYPKDAPPVFFGHYCIGTEPNIVQPNLCCVDSCVARGKELTAYRWWGERQLKADNIVKVKVDD